MRIDDWDIGIGRRYIRPYVGSTKLSIAQGAGSNYHISTYGRDFFITFLGLMFYLVIVWR